jgi:hypothetical protein
MCSASTIIFWRLNSECTYEIYQCYRPLNCIFRPYVRVAYIMDILHILSPYLALTFSAQNPDVSPACEHPNCPLYDMAWTENWAMWTYCQLSTTSHLPVGILTAHSMIWAWTENWSMWAYCQLSTVNISPACRHPLYDMGLNWDLGYVNILSTVNNCQQHLTCLWAS